MKLGGMPTTQQHVGEADVLAGCHLQLDQLEQSALPLPFEERRRGTVHVDATHPVMRGRDVNITMSAA